MGRPWAALSAALAGWTPRSAPASPLYPALKMMVLAPLSTRFDEVEYPWFYPPLPWLLRTGALWAITSSLCLLWGRNGETQYLCFARDLTR